MTRIAEIADTVKDIEATKTGELPAAQPFDLRTSIRFLSGFGACKGDQILTDDSIAKALAVDGRAVVFEVTPTPAGLAYRLSADTPIDAGVEQRTRTAIDRYLSLSDDLTEFYALAEADDPAYADLVDQLRGLHHVRFLTLPEIATWALVSQRTPKSHALGMKRRIQALGPATTVDGVRFQAFPEVAVLAELSDAEWFSLVRNERKAAYLGNMMRGLQEIGEDFLRKASYKDAYATLRSIKGAGDWTASAIMLRGLGRMDHVPLGMAQFQDAAMELYGRPLDADRVRRHYGEHLGYWSYYLRTGVGVLRGRSAQSPAPAACAA
ncbi:hypothetical protein [Catenulispora yoronensis]